jgi:hypothetical protein
MMNLSLRPYVKPDIIFIGKVTIQNNLIKRKILLMGILLILIYILMLVPIFFLYPNYNNSIKLNFEKKWFTDISKTLSGDCFRKVQDFRRKCPFPTREIHLNSEHTIVEVKINSIWIAYDPSYDLFFNNYNVTQISFDVNRKFLIDVLKKYPYKNSYHHYHFYNNMYFLMLNYTHPYYDYILRMYYGITN